MTISQRLFDATTARNKWNHWPDELAVKYIHEMNLLDPVEAYSAGKQMGRAEEYRQVLWDNLPEQVREKLPFQTMYEVHFARGNPVGQVDTEETRDIVAMIECGSRLILVWLGCNHAYQTIRHGPTLLEGTCSYCGHHFVVDSSD